MKFRILFQDAHYVAIDKPAGFHSLPPEDPAHRISKNAHCLAVLRNQLGTYLYPVHRLDRATSGVLIFGLSSEAASRLAALFREHQIQKRYVAVTRGWVAESGTIDQPLASEHDPEVRKPALTRFERVATLEIPEPVGRYATARYSLVSVEPKTGRMHQIRRHFASISHPLIGDSVHGDGRHNRFFREKTGQKGLLLKALGLRFVHPYTGEPVVIQSRWNHLWHQVFELFGVCVV